MGSVVWSKEAVTFVDLVKQKANVKSVEVSSNDAGEEVQLHCAFSIEPSNEAWWQAAVTTIRLEELEAPWTAFFGTEYVLDTKNTDGQGNLQLGYVWLLILIGEGGLGPVFSHLRKEILATADLHSLRRVPVDTIRVGPADRNSPKGVSRFGNKPSTKGAVKGVSL